MVRYRRDFAQSSSALLNFIFFCVEALFQHVAYLWVGVALGGVFVNVYTAVFIVFFYLCRI